MRKLKFPEGNGATMWAYTKRMKPMLHPDGEAYVCRTCGTELLYKQRIYKYYGNKIRSKAPWCPICLKFRDDSTRILQRFYYEGMRGRIKYYGMK